MKILLAREEGASREGFLRIDGDIDDHVEDAEATEIVADNVIDYEADPATALRLWARKLRMGGTISVSGLDLIAACHAAIGRRLSTERATALIHGGRSSASTAGDMADNLRTLGLSVESVRIINHGYCITARRP